MCIIVGYCAIHVIFQSLGRYRSLYALSEAYCLFIFVVLMCLTFPVCCDSSVQIKYGFIDKMAHRWQGTGWDSDLQLALGRLRTPSSCSEDTASTHGTPTLPTELMGTQVCNDLKELFLGCHLSLVQFILYGTCLTLWCPRYNWTFLTIFHFAIIFHLKNYLPYLVW